MKTSVRHHLLVLFVLTTTWLSTDSVVCTRNATYMVTFTAMWTARSHPKDYPSSYAHWSGLVGGSHNSQYTMWKPGNLSTKGMKKLAESGNKQTLLDEMEAQGNNVLDNLTLPVLWSGTGTRIGNLDVDGNHSLVCFAAMIVPSPDWFVGVHDLDLCNENTWIHSITVDLFPYDAGTNSGLSFVSPGPATNPQEPIYLLTGTNPNNSESSFYGYSTVPRMATLGFVLISPNESTTAATTSAVGTTTSAVVSVATTQRKPNSSTNQPNTTKMATQSKTSSSLSSMQSTEAAGLETTQIMPRQSQTPIPGGSVSAAPSQGCAGHAKYQVTYETLWTRNRFPKDFLPNAHFSGLVGGSHNDKYSMWKPGGMSTRGMEAMAESGKQLALLLEMIAEDDNMLEFLTLEGIGSGTGAQSRSLVVDRSHPLISLVSMIAPSPDWFVGVYGLDMCNQSIGWIPFHRVKLFPYDAGTDNGLIFTSPDYDTQPREPIHRLTNANPNNPSSSFYGDNPLPHIATLSFNLTDISSSAVPSTARTVTCLTAILITYTYNINF